MTKLQSLPQCLLIAAAFAFAGVGAARSAQDRAPHDGRRITVLNPAVTEKLAERTPLAPRLDSLEGKTIYLVDMNYEGMGGTPVLGEMQRWLSRNVSGAKAILRLKSGSYVSDDPALWKEIAENRAHGVILGVAG